MIHEVFQAAGGLNQEEQIEEQIDIDKARGDRTPGAPRLTGDESFPKVEDAANPEKVAGNKHHQEGKERQVNEAPLLVGVYEQEGGSISKDQRGTRMRL